MNLKQALALAVTAATLISSGAAAQETQPAPATTTATPTAAKPEQFKDWSLYCPQPKPNEPKICEIRTILLAKGGKPLGALAVGTVPKDKSNDLQVIASALVPLGVDLMVEPGFKVDDGKAAQMRYLRCLQRGCEAMTPLSDEQQTAMRSGSKAKVAVGIGGGKSAVFDFSLSGFSAALDAMKKLSGAK